MTCLQTVPLQMLYCALAAPALPPANIAAIAKAVTINEVVRRDPMTTPSFGPRADHPPQPPRSPGVDGLLPWKTSIPYSPLRGEIPAYLRSRFRRRSTRPSRRALAQ